MSSNSDIDNEKERKKPKLPRITVSLDEFDELLISKLVGYEGQNKSEVIRTILKKWIGANTDIIQNTYGIKFSDIRRELQLEVIEEEKEQVIERLIHLFKRMRKFEISKLADKMEIPYDTLIDIITDYGDELEVKGLNLEIDGNYIVKLE
ncbi:MAG: hypothetical protein ACFFA6_06865 [Promethearchaeota archaeon]